MKRYTIGSRWSRLGESATLGTFGFLFLMAGLINLTGPVEKNAEKGDRTLGDPVLGGFMTVMACIWCAAAVATVRSPCAVEIRHDGTIAIVRLLGRKSIRIGDIRAIEWRSERQILTIKHGRRSISLSLVEGPESFINEVRTWNPKVRLVDKELRGPRFDQ